MHIIMDKSREDDKYVFYKIYSYFSAGTRIGKREREENIIEKRYGEFCFDKVESKLEFIKSETHPSFLATINYEMACLVKMMQHKRDGYFPAITSFQST